MAHEKSIKIHDGSYEATRSGTTYSVDANLTIIGSGTFKGGNRSVGAIYEDRDASPLVDDNTYQIDGRVIGSQFGIETYGDHDRIDIGASGEVTGFYGVFATGEGASITNRGSVISSDGYGLLIGGADAKVSNVGTVGGIYGIVANATGDCTIVNQAKGEIFGLDYGLALTSSTGRFVNHGLLHGHDDQDAISGGGGSYFIRNDGVIEGDVYLGDGKDVLDTRQGTIQGHIHGGGGDDLLITDNAGYKLLEDTDSGADTVESTVSYKLSANVETLILIGKGDIDGTGTMGNDTLIGNDGDNKLVGGVGADTIAGGKGDDMLVGGNGSTTSIDQADRFVFSTGDGHDTIADFVKASDTLDFTNWTRIESIDDVVSHAHNRVQGHEHDVLIRNGDDSVLLIGVSKADLGDPDIHYLF